MSLSPSAKAILKVLVEHIQTNQFDASNPATFIGYKRVHDILNLPMSAQTYGESLERQGLGKLADWTKKHRFPAITGLIIDTGTHVPGGGYFRMFDKDYEKDLKWWLKEIEKSLQFDWLPYLKEKDDNVPADDLVSLEPQDVETPQAIDINKPNPPTRVMYNTYRRLRDTALARRVKLLYNNRCQICGETIMLYGGELYSEAHHIQPLGAPHNGPDVMGNILCVCPNHHVQLDYGAIELNIVELTIVPEHKLGDEYIHYHNLHIYKGS